MNKSELVSATAEKTGLSKIDVSKSLDGILDTIKEAVIKGDNVMLLGFGSFGVSERAEVLKYRLFPIIAISPTY